MSITASSLYRETGNFFRHQLLTILLLSLLTAFIMVILVHAFTPGGDELAQLLQSDTSASSIFELVRNMTPEQQRMLLRVSAAGTFSSLIGNTLLLGGMLCLIPQVSAGQRVSALRAIGGSAPFLPKLLLLVFLITLIVQLGFMVLMLPGLILLMLLSLSPVIMTAENGGVLAAMRNSTRLVWRNVRLVAPAILLWVVAKLVVTFAVSAIGSMPDNALNVAIATVGNLISALLIIYLYRLYMLVR